MLIGGCESGRRFCNLFVGFGSGFTAPSLTADVDFENTLAALSVDIKRGKLLLTDFLHDFLRFIFSCGVGSFSMLSTTSSSAPTSAAGMVPLAMGATGVVSTGVELSAGGVVFPAM
jgi:hypothetical protein